SATWRSRGKAAPASVPRTSMARTFSRELATRPGEKTARSRETFVGSCVVRRRPYRWDDWAYRRPAVRLAVDLCSLALVVILFVWTSHMTVKIIIAVYFVIGSVEAITVAARMIRWRRDPAARDRDLRRRQIEETRESA